MPKRLVVADSGPLNYLVLIETIDVLPRLFEQILVPTAVYDELAHADAPPPVRAFVAHKPAWLEVRSNPDLSETIGSILDEGERAAIALATSIGADLILMDDRSGVEVARRHGLTVTGTLGVLDLAARRGLVVSRRPLQSLRPRISDILLRSWTRCWRSIARIERDLTVRQYRSTSSRSRTHACSSGTASASKSAGVARASSTHSRNSGLPLMTSIARLPCSYS
jgi:predicted nucleic acid-binding protein